MQNNMKIKLTRIFSNFFIFFTLFLVFPFSSFSKELEDTRDEKEINILVEKKDNDLDYLPGEEVNIEGNKKIKVWSTKGTFRLEDCNCNKGCKGCKCGCDSKNGCDCANGCKNGCNCGCNNNAVSGVIVDKRHK